MLRVKDLVVHRAGRLVIDGLSFEVQERATLAVLGPNGAGKTTLLEAIAGLAPVTSGSIELDGVDLTRLPAHRRARLGLRLIGEGRRVVPQLTVAENLGLARLGSTSSLSGEEMFPRLGARRRTAAGQLSGGEQQMLALAMGLLAEPRILLLDEPSFGLAPQVVDDLFATLKSLSGMTLVLAEQHVQRALDLCAHVLVLRSGRAVFDSGPDGTRLEAVVDGYLGREDEIAAVPSTAEVTDLVSVRLPVSLKRRLQLEARRRGADPGELVAEAVSKLVGRR